MANFGTVCDFIIRIIILFTTILALVFFAGQYPQDALIFGFLALLLVLAIITKGLYDIFSKK